MSLCSVSYFSQNAGVCLYSEVVQNGAQAGLCAWQKPVQVIDGGDFGRGLSVLLGKVIDVVCHRLGIGAAATPAIVPVPAAEASSPCQSVTPQGQISAWQEQVNALEGRVELLKKEVDTQKEQMDKLKNEVTEFRAQYQQSMQTLVRVLNGHGM